MNLRITLIVFTLLGVSLLNSCTPKKSKLPSKFEIYAYHWRNSMDEVTLDWKFILDYYIEIDSSGNSKIKRRKHIVNPQLEYEYFAKQIPDSINIQISKLNFK